MKSTVIEFRTLQVQKTHSSNNSTDKADFQLLSRSPNQAVVEIRIGNWANKDIFIISFYQEVYGLGAMHVSEQRFPMHPNFEKHDIVKRAPKPRLSSEQLLIQDVQTKICPFASDVLQLHCQISPAPPWKLERVYEWIISSYGDQLNVAYEKGLYRSPFSKTNYNKYEREKSFILKLIKYFILTIGMEIGPHYTALIIN